MPVILKNNAFSTIATAITTSDTGIAVVSGAAFPTLAAGEYFYVTLVSQAGQTEIVKVTARVGNSMTVVRAQDGSTAASFQVGTLVEMRVNVATVSDLVDETYVTAAAAPTTGTYSRGQVIWNTTPTAGGYVGWVCVTAGTPGTWKQFGAILS